MSSASDAPEPCVLELPPMAKAAPRLSDTCPSCSTGKLALSASGRNLVCVKCGRVLTRIPKKHEGHESFGPLKVLREWITEEDRDGLNLPEGIKTRGHALAWLLACKASGGNKDALELLETALGKKNAKSLLKLTTETHKAQDTETD